VPEGVSLPPGTVTLGFAPTGAANRAPIARFRLDATPFVGRGVFAVAAGALPPAGGRPGFQLLVVDTSEVPWEVSPVQPQR
jgi:hypothetical protein